MASRAANGLATSGDTRSIEMRVFEPRRGWKPVDLRELWQYRDLFRFLVWRDIKVRYAQSVLGIGWAVIQPLVLMVVFTAVFGEFVNVDSDGVPYPVFSYIALVPMAYFTESLNSSTGSLIQNTNMLSKVYFPRLVLPVSAAIGKLLDFMIAFVLVGGLMAWFKIVPTYWALMLPILVLLMFLSAAGLGMWLTALAIQYRDVKYAMTFVAQVFMYGSPVVYPVSAVPDDFRLVYGLNPMVGIIEGFRSAFLNSNPMPWDLLAVGAGVSVFLAVSGMFYFRRMERIFADVA